MLKHDCQKYEHKIKAYLNQIIKWTNVHTPLQIKKKRPETWELEKIIVFVNTKSHSEKEWSDEKREWMEYKRRKNSSKRRADLNIG